MSRTSQLFARVYASPGDDAVRTVLADHLQELGDPRGEFIALQLAKTSRKPTPAATRRERALLEKHRTEWLGALAGIVNEPNSTWARGFLDTVVAELRDDTPTDPAWNTVRSLQIVGGFPPRTAVLGKGCFAALTEVKSIAVEHLDNLLAAKRKPPIESLGIYGPNAPSDGNWNPPHVKAIDRLVGLPHLSRVRLRIDGPVTASHLEWLWRSPITRRVKHLELALGIPFDLGGCLIAANALANLESLALSHNYYAFELTRDRKRSFSRLVITWAGATNSAGPLQHVASCLRALPEDALTAVRFDHPTARWTARALQAVNNAIGRQVRIR